MVSRLLAEVEAMGLSSVASAQVIMQAQGQTNERLDALIEEQRYTNRLLLALLNH
jgi:hypothetical protein